MSAAVTLGERELAWLEGRPRGARLVNLPSVDDLDDEGYATALSEGLRSLLDRGLVGEDMQPELREILIVRELPERVVVLVREEPRGERKSIYVYATGEGGFLLESCEAAGRHSFRMQPVVSVAAALAEFVDPHARARDDGSVVESADTVEGSIGRPNTIARLVAVRRTDGDGPTVCEVTIASSATGLWLVGEDSARPISAKTCLSFFERVLVG